VGTSILRDSASRPGRKRGTLFGAMPRRKEPQTILVIEHDNDLRATLCTWLGEAGFEAIGEHNGHSGLSRIALRQNTTKPIAGVLMSISLGLFESRLALSELRDRHPSMPVVVLAEARQYGLIEDVLQLGAIGQLYAPFDPDSDSFKRKCSAFFRNPDQPVL